MPAAHRLVLFAAIVGSCVAGAASPALAFSRAEPQDQIVLSGSVDVPRGAEVGEVVVLHGDVTISGVAGGDVVVLDGRVDVFGQVSGSVIDVNGPVVLGPSAQVGGDVLARGTVTVRAGASVAGSVRQRVAFTFRTPVRALGRSAGWLAVSVSSLVLGLLLLLVTPRGADAVFNAASSGRWASTGWGITVFLGLPVLAVGLPFGLGLLLALAFLYFVGYAWAAWSLGRVILGPPRNRALAFLVGWAILRAVALVPFAGGATWAAGAVYGLGAMTVAVYRVRRQPGRHREGRAARVVIEVPEPAAPEPAAPIPESTPPAGGVL